MSLFNDNPALRQAIFTALDYSLWLRHDTKQPFVPFMMLYKDGKLRVKKMEGEDPIERFKDWLYSRTTVYDQIVICLEGKIRMKGKKEAAVIITGFDTSEPTGITFVQRFNPLEKGTEFKLIGSPGLVSRNEKLPVPLVERDSNKFIERPFLSVKNSVKVDGDKDITKVFTAGHKNPSTLASSIFGTIIKNLVATEEEFKGEIIIDFMPDTVRNDSFSRFVFSQLEKRLKEMDVVKKWEKEQKRQLRITFIFKDEDTGEPIPFTNQNLLSKEASKLRKDLIKGLEAPWWTSNDN